MRHGINSDESGSAASDNGWKRPIGSKAGSCDSEANGIRAGTMAACAGGSSLFSKAKGQLYVGGLEEEVASTNFGFEEQCCLLLTH